MVARPKIKKEWVPCYANPERGIGFFDGILIEADPITDPRWDRVLPVLEEEQIFMCRRMSRLLKPGQWVLDVGTGSGVLAIWAAQHGCKVVAIDINPRALRIAAQNAKANKVATYSSIEELNDGSIFFVEEAFDESFNRELFDIVLLEPPYNPTCTGIKAPLHANAGRDGQEAFQRQITVVPKILKWKGCCIGNQMTLERRGKLQFLNDIASAFNRYCQIDYTRIIEHDISIREFLTRQYASYLKTDSPEHTPLLNGIGVNTVEEYIADLSKENTKLALVYYEVTKYRRKQLHVKKNTAVFSFPIEFWDRRVHLHKNIVEHVAEADQLYLPSVLLTDFPTPLHGTARSTSKTSATIDDQQRWAQSRLSKVDSFIKWHTDNNPELQLDILFIDTSPIYRTLKGTQSLRDECKVWLSNQSRELSCRILKEWQVNTRCLQRAKVAPFLHPSFTGLFSASRWAGINYSTLDLRQGSKGESELDRNEEYRKYEDWLKPFVNEAEIERDEILRDIHVIPDIAFSYSTLATLAVPRPTDYYNMLNNERRLPGLREAKLNGLVAADSGEVVKSIISPSVSMGRKIELIGILQHDLELCHRLMHRQVNRRCAAILERETGQRLQWSSLIGLPLAFGTEEFESAKSYERFPIDDLPDFYRGGVWLYGASTREWTMRHEQFLFDVVKFTWALCMDQYTLDAILERHGFGMYEQAQEFAHQTAGLLNDIWGDPYRDSLLPSSVVSLWHLRSMVDIWGKGRINPHARITDKGSYFPESKQLTTQEYLDRLISLGLRHALRRGSFPPPENDAVGNRTCQLVWTILEEADPVAESRRILDLRVDGEIPDWIKEEGFILCFHHCFWQSAYHAFRSMCNEQSSPFLRIEFADAGVSIVNIAEDKNQADQGSEDRDFFDRLQSRLSYAFRINGPLKDGNHWKTTILRQGDK